MIQENLYTLPTESLRFAYTEEQIKARIVENIKRIDTYIAEQESLVREYAAKSGATDIPMERILKVAKQRNGMLLRHEAEMALHHANLAETARSRKHWLTTIRDHGVYTNKHNDGRVLLFATEVRLLVEPFDGEQIENFSPAPLAGLHTAMRRGPGIYAQPAMPEELSLGDALGLP